MDWWDLLTVQVTLKSLLQQHSSKASILQRSAFFTVQLSHPYMTTGKTIAIGSVQFSHSVMSNSLRPHESQHTRPPCPSPTLEFTQTHVHRVSDDIQPSHPLSSPSPPAPNPSQHQSLFQWVNFASGGQSTGASASASFLPKKSQGWSPSEWIGWISLQSKGLSRAFSNTTVQKHQFFGAQPSSQSNSHIHTWLLEKPQPSLDGP